MRVTDKIPLSFYFTQISAIHYKHNKMRSNHKPSSLIPNILSIPNHKKIIERHTRVRWFDDDNNVIADSQFPQLLQEQYDRVLHPNGSLEVINVQLNDTGNYICEVTIGYRVFKQVNAIEVQGNLIKIKLKM